MKSFRQYLREALSYRRKGWINVKTGKMVLYAFAGRGLRPYHDEYVVNNPKKFVRGGEEELLRRFAAASGFEPEDEETTSMWIDIKTGKVDRDPNLDSILEKEGWRRVVFDEGISSVEPLDRREGQKLVKMIMDQIPWSKIENLNVFDKGHLNDMTELYSEDDAYNYIKTGRVVRRTSIGRTMAMFRGESLEISEAYKGEHLIGWVDSKNKLHLHPSSAKFKYHTQILTDMIKFEDFRKFMPNRYGVGIAQDMMKFVRSGNMTEKQLKSMIDANYQSIYNQLKSGKIDGDEATEENFVKAGWVKIRIDRTSRGGSSILGDSKRCHAAAKILDKELGGWQGISTSRLWVENSISPDSLVADSNTWDTYVKTGRLPKKTDIGRTMSQFRESIDKAEFRAHWKKAPILTTGGGNVKQRNQFWDSYFQHFEDKYGPIPNRIKDAMRLADTKPNPSITHKGKKFSMRTGMDEMDLLYHVLNENHEFMLPDYPEQIPASEDEGDWAMGDPDDPIDWKGDHKKVYRDVMKDRKKKNPKYKVPKGPHTGI